MSKSVIFIHEQMKMKNWLLRIPFSCEPYRKCHKTDIFLLMLLAFKVNYCLWTTQLNCCVCYPLEFWYTSPIAVRLKRYRNAFNKQHLSQFIVMKFSSRFSRWTFLFALSFSDEFWAIRKNFSHLITCFWYKCTENLFFCCPFTGIRVKKWKIKKWDGVNGKPFHFDWENWLFIQFWLNKKNDMKICVNGKFEFKWAVFLNYFI